MFTSHTFDVDIDVEPDRLNLTQLRKQSRAHTIAMQKYLAVAMQPEAHALLLCAVGADDPAAAGRLQDVALMLCGSPFPADLKEWRNNLDALEYLKLFTQEPANGTTDNVRESQCDTSQRRVRQTQPRARRAFGRHQPQLAPA